MNFPILYNLVTSRVFRSKFKKYKYLLYSFYYYYKTIIIFNIPSTILVSGLLEGAKSYVILSIPSLLKLHAKVASMASKETAFKLRRHT